MEWIVFFFNDTATTEIYTLSLHDALPIWAEADDDDVGVVTAAVGGERHEDRRRERGVVHGTFSGLGRIAGSWASETRRDRKSTRLNSSHANISYAVFCLQKRIGCHVHLPA